MQNNVDNISMFPLFLKLFTYFNIILIGIISLFLILSKSSETKANNEKFSKRYTIK